ncbi:hypothetical protein BN1183_CC_00380 [Pantoea ananatis]|nr:hypothetical protein BN1183_CC_00380 [Pantoea ananatis]
MSGVFYNSACMTTAGFSKTCGSGEKNRLAMNCTQKVGHPTK